MQPILKFGLNAMTTTLLMTAQYSVFAEANNITDREDETLIITAPRTLPNASGIEDDVIQTMRAATSDTASLLKTVPGVNLQSGGGVSNIPVIQGMADDRLRIKVDGMDLIAACANHMNPPLSYIDPTNVATATVFAGITPVSIGGDSIGSTILVDSARAEFSNDDDILSSGEMGLSYRSNGGVMSGNIEANIANRSFSISYKGSTTEGENYSAGDDFKAAGPAARGRDYLAADEVGSTMFKSTNHSLLMGYKFDDHLVELKLGKQDIPYQGWVNQRMDMTRNDSTQINLSYEGQFDWGALEGRVYSEETRHSMQFYDDKLFWYGPNNIAPDGDGIPCVEPVMGMNGCAGGMPMDTEGDNKGLTIKANIQLSDADLLRVGLESQNYQLDDWWEPSGKGMWPNTFVNINNGQRDRLALFTEWESKIDTQWLVQFGLRYEQVDMMADEVHGYNPMMAQYGPESAAFNAADRSKTDNNVDLTVLTRYQADNNSAIEFGYARKTRSPNLYERYTWSTGGMVMRMINMTGDGNGYVGNLELEPETAHTISAKVEWKDSANDKWQMSISPYYTYIEDYIDANRCQSANMNCGMMNQTATDAFVYLKFVNESARMFGIDVSGDYSLVKENQYGDISVSGVVSYLKGKNETTDDNLYNMMPLNIKLAVNHAINDWTNHIEIELVDAKTKTSAVRNEIETHGYGLMHLRSNYKWNDLYINVGIENVFDRFYSYPLSGTYIGQGKTMNATGIPWGTNVPGMGRNIYAGVVMKF